MLIPLAAMSGSRQTPSHARVVIVHGRLFQDGRAFRNIGVTVPDVISRLEAGKLSSLTTTVLDAKRVGARFVSFPLLQDSAGIKLMAQAPGSFAALTAKAINLLAAAGLSAVPTIVGSAGTIGAYFRAQGESAGNSSIYNPSSPAHKLVIDCATLVAAQLANNPSVLFWQAGDNLNAGADTGRLAPQSEQIRSLLGDISEALHSRDRYHLVCSGNGAMRPDAWHLHLERLRGIATPAGPPQQLDSLLQREREMELLTPPGINIESVHLNTDAGLTPRWLEPEPGSELDLPWIQYICAQLGRPLFVSGIRANVVDAPQTSTEVLWLVDVFRRLQASGMPPAAVSLWEPDSDAYKTSTSALSFKFTPRLAVAMRIANGVIDNSQNNDITLSVGPPLSATDQTVTAFGLQEQAVRLQKVAADAYNEALTTPGKYGNQLGGAILVAGLAQRHFTPAYAALMSHDRLVTPALLNSMIKVTVRHINGAAPIECANHLSVPAYSVPEYIALNGDTSWFPDGTTGAIQGSGVYGALPPADLPYWFIDLVYRYYKLTSRISFFNSFVVLSSGERMKLSDLCNRVFSSVPADKTTGLVSVNTSNLNQRAACSLFAGTVQSGECLWPSLLRFQAARQLTAMFTAAGDSVNSQLYLQDVTRMRLSLPSTFYLPLGQASGMNVGMLISSVVTGRRDDIWGSSLALQMQAFSPDIEQAIARHLDDLYAAGAITQNGTIRTLPATGSYGVAWRSVTPLPGPGTVEGYGVLPVAWLVKDLMLADPNHAEELLMQAAQRVELDWSQGGPWESSAGTAGRHSTGRFYAGILAAAGYAMSYFAPDTLP